MSKIKSLIKKYLIHFSYFYHHLGYRIFIAFLLSFTVGLLDGLGLAMFLPLLQMVDGSADVNPETLGGMSFLIESIELLGFELNLYLVLGMLLTLFVLKGVMKFMESYYNVLTQQYFIRKLRFDSLSGLSDFDFKSFVLADSGRIQNTLSAEVGRVSNAYAFYFAAVQSGTLVFVYLILAFFTDPQFALLVAVGGGATNLLYNRVYKKTKETSKKITSGGHTFQGMLIQKVAFYKYLKATGFIKTYELRLREAVDYIVKSNKKIGFYNALLVAAREPMVIFVVVVVIIVQVNVFSQQLGVIILSLLFFYRSLNSLVMMQTQWNGFLNLSGSLENMTAFMKELQSQKESNGVVPFEKFEDSICLDNAGFSYGNKMVLAEINLTISKNKAYAFVGESGSGKSTLVNLIAGLMPVSTGSITVDGVNLEEIEKLSFKKRIGYIAQEPVIFSDTIFNNVTQWSEPTPENQKRFWKALEQAAIADFVLSLPEKENANLGSAGILISGGQKQRLSIARELFKDVDILIMDEATSALDSETEKIIQENIEKLKGKYTLLIVAHRLSTIKSADEVILLNHGQIENRGAFSDLIRRSDSFQKMVQLQEI
ncbi:MAG: ABC transporter ATP-binding protein [Cyclobacteriaceae bacterium]|nr:ABC transporter ATP-binding protein [Cyclobacteriaceae bacterium]